MDRSAVVLWLFINHRFHYEAGDRNSLRECFFDFSVRASFVVAARQYELNTKSESIDFIPSLARSSEWFFPSHIRHLKFEFIRAFFVATMCQNSISLDNWRLVYSGIVRGIGITNRLAAMFGASIEMKSNRVNERQLRALSTVNASRI